MNWPAAIVVIVLIMMVGGYLRGRNSGGDQGSAHWQDEPQGKSPREEELEAELKQLRERVKVLERIATDGNDTARLSAEIDKLRKD